jgi:hypothetical protein
MILGDSQQHNFGETFRRFAKSQESLAGTVLVDGQSVRVVICATQALNNWIHQASVDQQALEKAKAKRIKENDRRERESWAKFPPVPEPIEGRSCGTCGGQLVLVVLTYNYERGTDIFTPADTEERCLGCGRTTTLPQHRL